MLHVLVFQGDIVSKLQIFNLFVMRSVHLTPDVHVWYQILILDNQIYEKVW